MYIYLLKKILFSCFNFVQHWAVNEMTFYISIQDVIKHAHRVPRSKILLTFPNKKDISIFKYIKYPFQIYFLCYFYSINFFLKP